MQHAACSMQSSDVVAIISAAISLFALFVSLYSGLVARKVATSDFQAVEKVKAETAHLVSALRALILKGVVYSQQDSAERDDPDHSEFISTEPERKAIESFMHSSTALAYHTYVIVKSKAANDAGIQSENWRTFFLRLTELSLKKHPRLAANSAAALEIMLDKLNEKELKKISSYLADIPNAIEILFSGREHDTLLSVMTKHDDDLVNDENFIEFAVFLREIKNVQDPELDLFIAASTGNLELLKSAMDAGANVNVRTGALINRYKRQIPEFVKKTYNAPHLGKTQNS